MYNILRMLFSFCSPFYLIKFKQDFLGFLHNDIEGQDLIITRQEMRKLEMDMIHRAFTLLLSYQTQDQNKHLTFNSYLATANREEMFSIFVQRGL